jgi:hypothetical protein
LFGFRKKQQSPADSQALMAKLDGMAQGQAHQYHSLKNVIDRTALLTGQVASQGVRRLDRIRTLADVEFRVTSQWGEDGIIEWLVHKLPDIPRSFVEFGVENYSEANTRFLLQNRGWRGLVIDGGQANIAYLRTQTINWMFDIVSECAFVTAENINDLIQRNGFAGEIGILSIDIDGNDYWVLDAIDCVRPAILICEVNGVFGDLPAITIPYDPNFDRLKAHHSGQYFGASVRAITELAQKKGYKFVGTNSNGVNAFYVRSDLADTVLNAIEEIRTWPARHRDSRDASGALTFVRGAGKIDLIKHLTVHDIETGQTRTIESLLPVYSQRFMQEM